MTEEAVLNMVETAIEVKPAAMQLANERHLPVLAATAAAVVGDHAQLRKVAVLAAAAVAANVMAGHGLRGRRVVRYRRGEAGPWVTRGRVRVMTYPNRHSR
ncbi:MAG: hypothetical protein KAS72_14405 [Phycisphaerales bacterium]|nr:hypothetical protein [Phycisphaerales bacterium]